MVILILLDMTFCKTPPPPYYAVIFTTVRTEGDNGYNEMSDRMWELVQQQPGFLGMDSARDEVGITTCYWKDLESIAQWRNNSEHMEAIKRGKEGWYSGYKVRIAKVEREYEVEVRNVD